MTKIAIISGSPSETSRLNGISEYESKLLKEADIEVEWVHVRQLPPEDLIYTKFDSKAILEANRIVALSDQTKSREITGFIFLRLEQFGCRASWWPRANVA